jgi:hypothetical protein
MNAMLDPRIVAASTHDLEAGLHSVAAPPDRMTLSSQDALAGLSEYSIIPTSEYASASLEKPGAS